MDFFGNLPNQSAADPVAEARERLHRLEKLAHDLQAQIESERRTAPPSRDELEAAIVAAQSRLQTIGLEIEQQKLLAKRRKREIKDWKLWFEGLREVQREVELARLNAEIAWRSAEISAAEREISRLIPEEGKALADRELAHTRLAAVEAGLHGKASDDDPRIVALNEARKQALLELRKLEPHASATLPAEGGYARPAWQ